MVVGVIVWVFLLVVIDLVVIEVDCLFIVMFCSVELFGEDRCCLKCEMMLCELINLLVRFVLIVVWLVYVCVFVLRMVLIGNLMFVVIFLVNCCCKLLYWVLKFL